MSKLLGIDFGKRRIGLAISDDSKKMAHPLAVLENRSRKEILWQIEKICNQEDIEGIIIGLPLSMKGEEGRQVKLVKSFTELMRKNIHIPIYFEDERLTTKISERYARQIRIKKKQRRAKLDKLSACFILQSYLDKIKE